jgi:hypothetical protein
MARIHLFPGEATPENVLTSPGAPLPVGGPILGPSAGPASTTAIPRQRRGPRGPVPAAPTGITEKSRGKGA